MAFQYPTMSISKDIFSHKYEISELFNSGIKKMHTSTVDLLAVAVCWRRIRTEPVFPPPVDPITEFSDARLRSLVTPSDIEHSQEIRDYFSKKLMMLAIKADRPFTPFRKDLSSFMQSDGTTFTQETIPLALKLPELYDYDIKLKNIIAASKQDFVLADDEYKFLGKIYRSRKTFKKFQYWFVDNKQNLHCVSIDTQNNLLGFWDNQLENNSTGIVKLLGKAYKKSLDDLVYFDSVP
jgi:hypothetical protein